MTTSRMLMCPPDFFDIEYAINPWMDTNNRVDKPLALAQWQAAHRTLQSLGVTIELVEPVAGLPDMTFAGDCGLAFGRTFLAANFRHPERQGESDAYIRWFEGQGYDIVRLPSDVYFEGLGDIIHYEGDIIFGYGPRSSREALPYVLETFPHLNLLCELEMADENFYHAGIAIALIGKGTAIYYSGAFTPESNQLLARQLDRALPIGDHDATVNFVCNNVVFDDKILMADCSSELEQQLAQWGLTVIKCDMSEYKKSGASVRCLVLDLP